MSERGDNSKKHGLPVISSCLNYKCGFVDFLISLPNIHLQTSMTYVVAYSILDTLYSYNATADEFHSICKPAF